MVTGFNLGLYALHLIGNVHLILHQLALLFYRQMTHGDKKNKDKESSHLFILYLELTSTQREKWPKRSIVISALLPGAYQSAL